MAITKQDLQMAMPQHMASTVTQGLVDTVNQLTVDPEFTDQFRENTIGYMSVLQSGKYKLTDYINAVKYVSYLLMGDKNVTAWGKTFPTRYAKLVACNASNKTIHAHSSMYRKNKLVSLVYEQSMIPSHILNASVFQDAINTQAAIMGDQSVSPKVRSDAANSLMTHLKPPETRKVELDMVVRDDSIIQGLKEVTVNLATEMQNAIAHGGLSVKDVSHKGITVNQDGEEV